MEEAPTRAGPAAAPRPGRTVLLAGTRVALWAATEELASLLRWHFGRLPEAVGAPAISIVVDQSEVSQPDQPVTMQDGPISRWEGLGADLVLHHELGSGARVDGGELHVGLTCSREHRWRVLRQLLFSALSWLFEQRGRLVLHGAMVAQQGGAVLVVGPTGAGKSTAALAALRLGWELHADDLVVVRTDRQGLRCSGVPKRPSIDPSLAPLVGLHGEDLPADPRGRLLLTADSLTVGDRRLVSVVQVAHDSGPGRLERLDAHETLTALVEACLEVPRDGVMGRHLALFAAMAARPGYRLAHAAEPEHRLARASELLGQVWDRATHEGRDSGVGHERAQ